MMLAMRTETTRPLWAEIDLSAIRHNVQQAKQIVGERVDVMAVVKANAYGHGAARGEKAACEAGASCLGVALPEEGAQLRESGIPQPIHVLAEPSPGALS